jgi:CRP-like cAMP-binding protein
MAMQSRPRNQLLSSLPPGDEEMLRPHLRTVELLDGANLAEAGKPVERAYFPESGIISLVVSFASGAAVDVAMIGRDSVLGGWGAMNGETSPTNAIVRRPGAASVLDAARLRAAVKESAPLRAALLLHEEALSAQVQQSAACNAVHGLELRLRRCLLRLRDLSGDNRLYATQELLADMLGAHRNSVSIITNALQHARLISYSRGVIEIENLEGLRAGACECYRMVKMRYDGLPRSGDNPDLDPQ